jgi:DNA-binding TFAR19-related protein (PDSD5 family)
VNKKGAKMKAITEMIMTQDAQPRLTIVFKDARIEFNSNGIIRYITEGRVISEMTEEEFKDLMGGNIG